MVGWHHQLDGCEYEQAPGVGNGQGNLACCSPWGHNESDMTELLKWTKWCMGQHERNLKKCCQPKDAINKEPYIVLLHLYKMSRIDKSIETQSWFPMTRGMEIWWRMRAKQCQLLWGMNGNVLKVIVVMDTQLCEHNKAVKLYTLNEWIVWYVNYISIKQLKDIGKAKYCNEKIWLCPVGIILFQEYPNNLKINC